MLIVFAGLPGTGKTTIAQVAARRLRATYLRIDTIEQALRASGSLREVMAEGYAVAYRVAAENLRLGRTVIADSVNPIPETRESWVAVARDADVQAVEVEIVCSDRDEPRSRVETRSSDIAGLSLPSWDAVTKREYHPWTRPRLVIDTAGKPVEACVDELISKLPTVG